MIGEIHNVPTFPENKTYNLEKYINIKPKTLKSHFNPKYYIKINNFNV